MIYEENGVMMIQEVMESGAKVKRFYSMINTLKATTGENGILVGVYKYDDTINFAYNGEVEIIVNEISVSRETIIDGLLTIDLSTSELGEYEIVIKSNELNDCVVTYEKS